MLALLAGCVFISSFVRRSSKGCTLCYLDVSLFQGFIAVLH
jgi:hypothetical protein